VAEATTNANIAMAKPAMEIANAVAMKCIVAANPMTSSEGAIQCKCTGGKRRTAESKADSKNNHGLMRHSIFLLKQTGFMNVPC
jgi:hypothetical protein